MTTLQVDAKEFVPSSSQKSCHMDATTKCTTTSSSVLLSHSDHPRQKDKRNCQSRSTEFQNNRNNRRRSVRKNISEVHGVSPDEKESADIGRHHPAQSNEKIGKCNSKRRNDMNSKKKTLSQPCKLKTEEVECASVFDTTTEVAPTCSHPLSNPMNCEMEFPELQPPKSSRHGKSEESDIPSRIWSSVIIKNLVQMVANEPSESSEISKYFDGNDKAISVLVPLTQPVYTSRQKPAITPLEEDVSVRDSCPVFDKIQYPTPQMQNALVRFERLRDRWWNLLLSHEEKQRLAEKEGFLVDDVMCDFSILEEKDEFNQKFNFEKKDHVTLSVDVSGQAICLLSHQSNKTSCGNQQALKLPLHDAIYSDDIESLKQLISAADANLLNSRDDVQELTPLQLAVKLNRPHLVHILCLAMEQKECKASDCTLQVDPLLMATNLGHHECLQAILSVCGSSSLLSIKDAQGSSAMHYACLEGARCVTFQCILQYITSSCTASFLFKTFACRNNQEQMLLHVAAQNDRVDIVDIVLNHRSTSSLTFLSKILTMHDFEGQTPLLAAISSGSSDVVMSFLMWRGNSCSLKRSTGHAVNGGTLGLLIANSTCCPLCWAVKYKNIDMVKLLLEFNDPSSDSGFKLRDALYFSVNRYTLDDKHGIDCTMLEIVRVLVDAGANPCVVDNYGSHGSLSSVIAIASSQRKLACLAQLLEAYEQYLKRVCHQRRHDPKLQSQPESFFVSLETAENAERDAALREALLTSLLMACSSLSHNNCSVCFAHIQCCILMYRKNVKLGSSELQRRLKESLFFKSCRLKPLIDDPFSMISICSRKAETEHVQDSFSRTMMCLPWFDARSFTRCAFLSSLGDLNFTSDKENNVEPDVVIVCNDGEMFLAHETILGQSHKFAAAIRFTKFSQEQSRRNMDSDPVVEVNIDLSSSIGRSVSCKELLELLLVADEFICTSLVHECLQRLLASRDDWDWCFCSFCRKEFTAYCSSSIGTDHGLGQSFLISAENILEVLAALEHMSCFSKNCEASASVFFVRETAFYIALCEFGSVIESDAFEAHFKFASEETYCEENCSAPEMFFTCFCKT